MAKRKQEVIIQREHSDRFLTVFADPEAQGIIEQIEGVMEASFRPNRAHLVRIDPRYDTDEVAADIERAIKGALLLQQWSQEKTQGEP